MSFLSNILSKLTKKEVVLTPEIQKLHEFEILVHSLLDSDKYIAQKDYSWARDVYRDIFTTFSNLHSTQMLDAYCETNSIRKERIEEFLTTYEQICNLNGATKFTQHNAEFILRHMRQDKSYLDSILNVVDPNIKLDEEQRKVVLADEDYMLVIAGAGAGKTTTVAAKVRYLVEKQHIRPDQILVISFTNKAVGELRDKINKSLGIPCPITTFHKTGYAILKRQDEERRAIVDAGFMYHVINNYLKGNILENPELVDKLILFFGSYFDAPYEGEDLNTFFNYISKADFSTIKGNIDEYTEKVIDKRTGKCISITHETLRSMQEVQIANFLYMHNIEYVYEKPYAYNILRSRKPYTPDFTIMQGDKVAYIEHFGITQDGRSTRYSEQQLERYKQEVNDKILLHRKHGTNLIYTFSAYNDGHSLLEHLQEELLNHGFELIQRPSKEVFKKIVSTEENKYISRLVKLVCAFIQNFKTNGMTIDDFFRFQSSSKNERTKLFLTICEQCYLEYAKRLKEKHAIDFEDMINDSARILREEKLKGTKLDFRYIIVDEYQDISRQRFNLTKELSRMCNAKIIAVGDDWQSIYAYAGSDITLFTKFKENFGYGLELSITRTYRNAQELIDIAGGFVQKNTSQIRKSLISPKHIKNPIIIRTYTEDVDRKKYEGRGGKYFLIGETVQNIMDEILAQNPKSTILLLGRYNFDAYNLGKSADFIFDEKTGNVWSKKYNAYFFDFMTVHRAKGLGYDNVILFNNIDSAYGFPSKIEDDPVLRYVVKTDHDIEYAEERRLFYVALTRTKNRVYLVVPKQRPSDFVLELLRDYPNIAVQGNLDTEKQTNSGQKMCPICGYPLQLRYKQAYGLRLWICSNEPEICEFMTNDLKGKEMSILKCEQCRDGYLIVKTGKSGAFLGCTNYKTDGCGCNKMMPYMEYKKLRFTLHNTPPY